MGIKNRITLTFTLIITIILLLLCSAVYIFSYRDRVEHFRQRLDGKANNTVILINTRDFNNDMLSMVNESIISSLMRKSIRVYQQAGNNDKYYQLFTYDDEGATPLGLQRGILKLLSKKNKFFFEDGERTGIAMKKNIGKGTYIVLVSAFDEKSVLWLAQLRTRLIIFFFVSIAVSLAIVYMFASKIVSSISNISDEVYHISSANLSQRLYLGEGKDELGKLASNVNKLLDKLQASFDTQRRFISNASHELATPLTSIISQMDVALQKERSNEEYRKVITSVKDDMRRLALLLKSLLEIAKASGSPGGIELSTVRIDELLMSLPADIKRISQLYDVRLDFDDFADDDTAFCVYGNPALLYSALRNIVHNACKFSRTKIAYVYLGFTDTHITVSVQDDGPGISPEDYDLIFQPFFRGYKQDNLIYGTGLGLALTHRIVSLHKGQIVVDTEVGKGSTFRVVLPRENKA